MFAMTVFTGMMVLTAALIGVGEIIKDLVQDYQSDYDWFWNYPVESVFSIPKEMFFFRDAEDVEFWGVVDDGMLVYSGFNPDDLADIMNVGQMMSDEGTKPLFIDIRSQLHREIDLEYKAERKHFKTGGNLTRMAIS